MKIEYREVLIYHKAWNKSKNKHGFICSECSYPGIGLNKFYKPKYCPECGAKIVRR